MFCIQNSIATISLRATRWCSSTKTFCPKNTTRIKLSTTLLIRCRSNFGTVTVSTERKVYTETIVDELRNDSCFMFTWKIGKLSKGFSSFFFFVLSNVRNITVLLISQHFPCVIFLIYPFPFNKTNLLTVLKCRAGIFDTCVVNKMCVHSLSLCILTVFEFYLEVFSIC